MQPGIISVKWKRTLIPSSCLALFCLFTAVLSYAQRPQITVANSGSADYRTIQEAVNHAPEKGGAVILIAPGTYYEKVIIRKPGIALVGTGKTPEDTIINWADAAKNAGSTFNSGTVWVVGDGFQAENLSIVNSYWMEHATPAYYSQAVALLLESDRAVLDRVRMVSGQDTLYANSSRCKGELKQPCRADRQLYNECFIEGHVDYIFGDANAVFDHCELHSHAGWKEVMITANGRHSQLEESSYYMLHCSITGANDGANVSFGRPWRPYASVLFYDTDIQQRIVASGWTEWEGRLSTSNYREYKSHGPGVNGSQRNVVYPALTSTEEQRLNAQTLLAGEDHWDPKAEVDALRALVPATKVQP